MELRDMKLLHSSKCTCGHEFTNEDIKPPIIKNNDYRFYGGRVKYYVETQCSKCRKQLKLLLEDYNNVDKFKIIDIALDANVKENVPYIKYNAPVQHVKERMKTNSVGSFKCEKCGREFRSNAGLASHARKCQG